jgi:hypothetical protein
MCFSMNACSLLMPFFECILQVGVLYEGQRFPVWIESGSVLVLQAVSTSPSKLVGLLLTFLYLLLKYLHSSLSLGLRSAVDSLSGIKAI